MATYTLAHKLPSMDSYLVTDEAGNHVFGAKHHTGLGSEHWDLTDAQGALVAKVTHERMHTHATYLVDIPGQPQLTLTKVNWMPVLETWSLAGAGETQTLSGDLGDYVWRLSDAGGAVIATLQRKLVSLHRQYHVTVEGDPRVPLIIALAVDAESDEHRR